MNWNKLITNYSLEDWYNILCRNKPHRNSRKYKEWDYLESIAFEALLFNDFSDSNDVIGKTVIYLQKEKKEILHEN